MSKDNSNVIIENCQVVFSKEVLEYFKNIETEENKEWIKKYFQVLSDQSNINAEKFNIHHIRPCFTFKDENHRNRKETRKLGDKFNGNKIKLSIYNHIMAHYYLWKIYNNYYSRIPVICLCELSTESLIEEEIISIALIKEECAKYNKDQNYYHSKEYKLYKKEYDKIRQSSKEYREQKKIYDKQYNVINHDSKLEKSKEYYHLHKKEKSKYDRNRDKQICFDPIKNEPCLMTTLRHRKDGKLKELYKNVILKDCVVTDINLIEIYKEYINNHKHFNCKIEIN